MYRPETNVGKLLDIDLNIYMLDEYDSAAQAVAAAAGDGAQIVIGVKSACDAANEAGLPSVSIFTGREGVLNTLRHAALISDAIDLEKKSAAENAAFMNSIFHGIIEVGSSGEILRLNDYAKNLLDCKDRNIVGLPLLQFFPRSIKGDLDTVLKTGQQVFTLDIKLMNRNMITNIEPIISANQVIGAVITIQKGQFVHMMTPERQNEVYSRGFQATHRFADFKSKSSCYENLIKQAQSAAYSNAPVLIYGEEGTEALRLAQCIHNESSRRQSGFVEVESGAWETAHLDEMLFGLKNYPGSDIETYSLVELAEGGTLYLSNIEALTNELQFRICRLIRGVLPQSDNRQITADIRVIASTHDDLGEAVNEGRFRSDLYYALNVLTLDLPPLRERKEDIESWIDYFLDHYCTLYTRPIQLSRGASRCMVDYPWPGNIRQLENFCHRIVLLTPRRNIDEAFVRSHIDQLYPAGNLTDEYQPGLVNRDKTAVKILEALKRHGGNRTDTARELGVSKTTLWRLMQKHGITTDYSV